MDQEVALDPSSLHAKCLHALSRVLGQQVIEVAAAGVLNSMVESAQQALDVVAQPPSGADLVRNLSRSIHELLCLQLFRCMFCQMLGEASRSVATLVTILAGTVSYQVVNTSE